MGRERFTNMDDGRSSYACQESEAEWTTRDRKENKEVKEGSELDGAEDRTKWQRE